MTNNNEEGFFSFGSEKQNTKIRFEDADEDEVAEGSGVAREEAAQDESMCDANETADAAEVTDDTTSADYYFDSYSHFGNSLRFFHLMLMFSRSSKIFLYQTVEELCALWL
ncbi:unnamed protein product [Thlaspi arvense]|uniref:Uncharacterized protein n=1 Tax=Thlaspi arvense TaxID=13288 RepID=A0AAU9T0C6_THLAR|nr:unnamed protein product [Thlaspi arvense]